MHKKDDLHWGSFLSAIAFLRKNIPPDLSVVVRRVRLKNNSGYCIKEGNKYKIKICNSLGENCAVLLLIHEWAHALAWHSDGSDHSPEWGKYYARCWRLFTESFTD